MSSTDSIAQLIAGIGQPVQPRAEFAETLLSRLLDELTGPQQATSDVRRRGLLRTTSWRRPARRWTAVVVALAAFAVALSVVVLRTGPHVETAAAASCGSSGAPTARCVNTLAGFAVSSRGGRDARGSRKIAFSIFQGLRTISVATINADGTGEHRLTNDEYRNAFPAWSPDGRRIAFYRFTPSGLYVMNADGSDQRLLARGVWGVPAWSPDGKKIAFARNGNSIYVVDIAKPDEHVLVREAMSPSWSPDGTKLAYVSLTAHGPFVAVMNADGRDGRVLAPGSWPAWSSDGHRIAYLGIQQAGNKTLPLLVMSADGSNRRRLGVRSWVDCNLAWSPGGRIIFSNPSGLFTVRPNGRDAVRIHAGNICGAAWQPQARR